MKMSSQQYNKLVRSQHDWTVVYNDTTTGKEVKFTCSNAMKRSHELMMKDNYHVKNVQFRKDI